MKKNYNNTWICGHCKITKNKINATKALAHLLCIPHQYVSACKSTNLHTNLAANSVGGKRAKITI